VAVALELGELLDVDVIVEVCVDVAVPVSVCTQKGFESEEPTVGLMTALWHGRKREVIDAAYSLPSRWMTPWRREMRSGTLSS
jgi:hypothetical protein